MGIGGGAMIRWLTLLIVSLLIWDPIAASAATPTCVAKLAFSSDDKSDSGTDAFVKQVLTGLGYSVIDDWLFTIWNRDDYDVKVIINHTQVPNYGFPVSLMGMQLFIADSSGKILVNNYVDRANLEGSLQFFVPPCSSSPSSASPDTSADAK
jgi:hypothetical protein